MGLLDENLIEKELTCGDIFTIDRIETPHADINVLGGHGYGLIPMKIGNPHKGDVLELVKALPLIADSKGRLRLDNGALITFVIGLYNSEIRKNTTNPEVSISTSGDRIYYVVKSDHMFPEGYDDAIRRVLLRLTLKK